MSEKADAIMDAAERRIREAGYDGFSFRDIASDVGVKSASVHYHFATKESLGAAVARRYTQRFMSSVEQDVAEGRAIVEAWVLAFRRSLYGDGRMCLCGALGVASFGLAEEVATEARRFFQLGIEMLVASGLSSSRAAQVLATLEGAMLLAIVLAQPSVFDEIVAILD